MGVGRIGSLTRYPVKSLGGERLDAVDLDLRGLVGDRQWALYVEDGAIASGKTTHRFRRVDGLLEFRAVGSADDAVLVIAPDGTTHLAGDPATDEALSRALGRQVELRREAAVSHHDDSPLHLVTGSALRQLADLVGAPVAVERFRANLVLDTGDDPVAEQSWTGRRLSVGEAVLTVGPPMPRCRMVDLVPFGQEAGPRVLTVLGQHLDTCLGLQLGVERPGRIRVDDPVRLS